MMRPTVRLALALCGLALVAACGGAGPSATPTGPAPAGPTAADAGDPGPVEPGRVTVTPSAPAYRVGEVVQVTVANGLAAPIYAVDGRTECSIVTLERWDGQRWAPNPACLAGRTDRLVAIAPGRVRAVRLDPTSAHFGVTPGFGAGTYRVAFAYGLAPDREAPPSHVAHSASFEVRS